MNQNSTVFQILTSVGTKIIMLFGSFIISVILARFLGPEGKGIVTAIFIIPNLLVSIADLGIKQATAYYVGKKIFSPADVLTSLLVLWVTTSTFSILVASIYYSTGPNQQYGWFLLMIPLATIPFMLLNKYTDGLFLGLQQVIIVNIKQLLGFVINFSAVCILIIWLDLGVFGASIITLIIALFTVVYSLIIIRRYISTKFSYKKGIAKTLVKRGLIYAIALFILNLNYKIDIVFLERLTTPAEVGIYSVGVAIAELIWQIPTAMGMVLFSKSANSKYEINAVNRSTKLLRMSWIPIITISILFWIFAPYLIKTLYGVEFIESASVIRILLPGVIAMVLFKLLNADLAGRGYPLFSIKAYIISLVINIVLNLLLIPEMGINGAAIASTISYSVGAILFSVAYIKQSNIKYSELFILDKKDVKLIKSSFLTVLKRLSGRD